MTELLPLSTTACTNSARALAAALEIGEAGLAGGLLALLDRMDAAVSIKDSVSGRYVYVNDRTAALFSCTPQQMIGSTDALLAEAQAGPASRSTEQATLSPTGAAVAELTLEREGVRRRFSVTRLALAPPGDAPARFVASVWIEITAHQQRESQLQQALAQLEQQQVDAETLRRETQDQAVRDSVTGLYQRMHFEDQLRREVDLSSREHREFSLVSIALDPLSDAVRALGAAARVRVFEALGRLLRSNTRAMDASCRVDEERFAVLLSGVGLATGHARMEGLRRQCATQIVVLDGRELGFTVSMGVASFPHTAHTEEELLYAADTALSEAQKRGGNHVTLASIRFEPA